LSTLLLAMESNRVRMSEKLTNKFYISQQAMKELGIIGKDSLGVQAAVLRNEVKAQLDQDIRLGVIERVPNNPSCKYHPYGI
jgi:hypothetical protein